MLIDHGSDSMTAIILGMQFLRIFQLDETKSILVLYSLPFFVFFIALWAQYSTGNFRLGAVNVVDEG